MRPNAFINKPKNPTDKELSAALGPAKVLWDQLLEELADEKGIAEREWHSYAVKAGWSLRVKHGKRTIVYLSPCSGCFRASFALGDRALKAARQSGLPKPVLRAIDEAKRYVEGTAVRIEVNATKDLEAVKKLAAAKLEN